MIFFTSDQHYGSQRALELSKRPFSSVEEMNSVMISNFNKKISNQDLTFHIGDFGDYDILSRLNGRHIIILGNYEIDEMNGITDSDKMLVFGRRMREVGFEEAYVKGLKKKIEDSTGNSYAIYMTHCPDNCKKDDPELFNLFGHIHGRQKVKRYGIDVGVDANHFYPISVDDVSFYRTAIYKYYDNNVFE